MRRRLLSLTVFLFVATTLSADRTLVIERFNAAVEVSPDGSIVVDETIEPRFTGSWNGIFRTIPVEYRTPQGLNYTLRLEVESVTDAAGQKLKYESSRERHYRKLKIWVPGAVDTARPVKLRYRVSNGLRFFDEHDELSWNVTGDEWEVPIVSGLGPGAAPGRGLRCAGDRLPRRISIDRTVKCRGSVSDGVDVQTDRGLGMREGLTLVVGWNPGVVHRRTRIEKSAAVVYSNLPLAVPAVVFIGHAPAVAYARTRSRAGADCGAVRASRANDTCGTRHAGRWEAGHA